MDQPSKAKGTENKPMHEQIATRAYQLWEKAGCQADRDQEYWFEAERQLNAAPPPDPLQTVASEHSGKPFTETRTTGVNHLRRGGNGRLRSVATRS